MNTSEENFQQNYDEDDSPVAEMVAPLACNIPLNDVSKPTFAYILCVVYSVVCLVILLTGGYFAVKKVTRNGYKRNKHNSIEQLPNAQILRGMPTV